jgi:hypothetical protein
VKILLDECVPRPLNQLLSGHESVTVQDRGWTGIRNSELLRRAQEEFDLFITSDQNIRYQQTSLDIRFPFFRFRRTICGAFALPWR